MDPFEINLVGETLWVMPQADGTFQIFRGENKIATLTPSIDEATGSIIWETAELISLEYVRQIGELIEEHEM
ncbi:hypothetical protein SAMN04488101_101131 [Pedobacter nyackensis]|uniref:Uncharacterized protein n=2 Tax=Pedobacter nyackensis TaxID=475255 RepID=A0A1W1ZXI4_9SPHI|nr:hypothetical protein SAMN04488101_101131 [Pedobacter nyackensis]